VAVKSSFEYDMLTSMGPTTHGESNLINGSGIDPGRSGTRHAEKAKGPSKGTDPRTSPAYAQQASSKHNVNIGSVWNLSIAFVDGSKVMRKTDGAPTSAEPGCSIRAAKCGLIA
jgi:hypothetical protein